MSFTDDEGINGIPWTYLLNTGVGWSYMRLVDMIHDEKTKDTLDWKDGLSITLPNQNELIKPKPDSLVKYVQIWR